jgi:DNA-directed RNA polymerase subunit omega
MLYPSIDKLMEKTDSKYSLVVLAAKRARQLLDGTKPGIEPRSNKYVGIAIEEIAADVVKPQEVDTADQNK